MTRAWIALIVAGLLEVGWATGLKESNGFTRPIPSILTVIAMGASFYLLSQAMKVLPASSAYGIWVGIGAVGTAILGMLVYGDSTSPLRWLSIVLVVLGLAGLKLTT
ncbi:QacE family quaternary ammonium compound efflux SMR transporter [Lujinxingia litoralis]|uniref:QacE family quaternary ammonium compound efflux SMR transporter n=1 Tax=Lujinxingia litoralis TaxID=2211119 RepID=A0A328C9Q7_9DELT|nr:multidrug efflux SMR transporter [Lujinxingia litoralis]RAL25367.1 QacE family quaternary ammonium compound efflux SMR transporter [Lujinxingia litoralis]